MTVHMRYMVKNPEAVLDRRPTAKRYTHYTLDCKGWNGYNEYNEV